MSGDATHQSPGRIPRAYIPAWLDDCTPHKQEMLSVYVGNALHMAVDIGRHRTIGGEDIAMREALRGLTTGILLEVFAILRMVDSPGPDIACRGQSHE